MNRRNICLNGEWNFMPDYENKLPEQLIGECIYDKEKIRVPSSFRWVIKKDFEYQPYDVFKYPEKWNEASAGIIAREFYVEVKKGERAFLIFKGILQRWKLYINNTFITESSESFVTTEIDITDYVNNNVFAQYVKVILKNMLR